MAEHDQIDPALVEVLQKAKVLDELYENPATRKTLLSALKTNKPDLRIPEVDAPTEVLKTLEPHMTEIANMKKELAQERDALRLERAKDGLMRKHNLTAEELADVGKTMKEKGIANVDTAIEHRRLADQVASPRSSARNKNAFQINNPEGLVNDPAGWANNEAYRMVEEFEKNRR